MMVWYNTKTFQFKEWLNFTPAELKNKKKKNVLILLSQLGMFQFVGVVGSGWDF